MAGADRIEVRVALAHALQDLARQRDGFEHVEGKQPGAQAVVYVMRVVGDVVGDRRALRLETGIFVEPEVEEFGKVADRLRDRAFQALPAGVGERAVVLDQALQRLPGEVQPVELGIAAFQPGDDAQRLGVVVEAAPFRHLRVQRILAGMAEGRVAEIVDQRDRLGEVLVAAQRPRQRAGDLRDLDRVGEPGAVVVALMRDEDLRLVLEAAEGGGVDDAVAVALERRAGRAFRLVLEAAARLRRDRRHMAHAGGSRSRCRRASPHRPCPCPCPTVPVDLPLARSYL